MLYEEKMTPIEFFESLGISTKKEIGNMNEEPIVNLDAITIEDCIEMNEYKGRETIINDGHVTDIVYPEFVERARY